VQVIDGVNDLIQELKDIDDAIAAQVGMGSAHTHMLN
jgi:flagellar hook-associated protein FlgK